MTVTVTHLFSFGFFPRKIERNCENSPIFGANLIVPAFQQTPDVFVAYVCSFDSFPVVAVDIGTGTETNRTGG